MGIFGEKKDSREKLREMISTIRKQKFGLERNITKLVNENKKLELDIKKRAKAGKIDEVKIMAVQLVSGRKTVSRLRLATAQADCLVSELNRQAASARMAGCLEKSTAIMQSVSALVKLPDFQKTMQAMSKEMMKMGLIDEMIEETMDSTMGDSTELEEATQAEVDKILSELMSTELANAPDALAGSIAVSPSPGVRTMEYGPSFAEPEESEEVAEMQARLAALKS